MSRASIGISGLIVALAGGITAFGAGSAHPGPSASGPARSDLEHSSPRASAPTTVIHLLTEEERAWLRRHPVIRVVQDPEWPPVEFTDDRGEPSGISEDYLKLVEQRLGITFERIRGMDWQEAFAGLKRWDVDMTTCVAETPSRREFWAFTKPYTRIPIVIVTQVNVTYVGDMRVLAGRKVAVVDGYVAVEHIPQDYPEIQLIKTKTVKEGLDLLERGEVFAVVDNMLVLSYYMTQMKLANLKIAGETPYVNAQAMAVRKDWAILAQVLQKALESISEAERSAIYQKWVPVRYEHGFDYTRLWQVLAVFAMVVAVLGIWVHRLSREVGRRKVAESSATVSESLLRIAGRTAKFGGWSVTLADWKAIWSDEVASIHGMEAGYSPTVEEGISFYAPEWRERITEVFGDCVREGAPYDEEMEIITARGNRAWVRTTGEAVRNESGAIIRVQGSFQDITDRKRAEEALQQEKQFSEAVFESLPGTAFVFGEDGLFLRWNRNLERVTGWSSEDLARMPVLEALSPKDRQRVAGIVRRAFETGDFETAEYDALTKDGREIPYGAFGRRFEMGGRRYLVGVSFDVTERRRAQQALQDSEERYRTLAAATFEGIVITEAGRIVDANDQLLQMLGYDRGDLIGMAAETLILPEDRERVMDNIRAARESLIEHTMVRKDGRRIIVEAHARTIDSQGHQLHLTALRDLTDRRQAEAKYAQILATALSGFWLTDLTGKLLEVNDAVCKMLGYSREELLTLSIADVEAAETPGQVQARIETLRRAGRDHFESRHRRKDGGVIDVEVSATLLDVGEGQTVSFIQDITERKRAEATLQGQLLELRRWHAVTLGRERRIQELKSEVNQMLQRLGEPARYLSEESREPVTPVQGERSE